MSNWYDKNIKTKTTLRSWIKVKCFICAPNGDFVDGCLRGDPVLIECFHCGASDSVISDNDDGVVDYIICKACHGVDDLRNGCIRCGGRGTEVNRD